MINLKKLKVKNKKCKVKKEYSAWDQRIGPFNLRFTIFCVFCAFLWLITVFVSVYQCLSNLLIDCYSVTSVLSVAE
jgi:hypothetical protein